MKIKSTFKIYQRETILIKIETRKTEKRTLQLAKLMKFPSANGKHDIDTSKSFKLASRWK